MLEDKKDEEVKTGEKEKVTPKKITNPQELSVALLNLLLPKTEKTLSYSEIATLLVEATSEFEKKAGADKTSPLHEENLQKASPAFAYKVTLYSSLTNLLAALAYHASPKEAEKIQELLKK